AVEKPLELTGEYIRRCKLDKIRLSDGVIPVSLDVDEAYYYRMLTELVGEQVEDEYQLINKLKEFATMKQEYHKVLQAVSAVRMKGYGVVTPDKEEIVLDKPELIKHGNKFGVKIKAVSPSIHMIRANIETEIAPIVGTKEQAEDLVTYINEADNENGIWDTNIFGKTVEQLVGDGITAKIAGIGEESQQKLQDTMQKIVNDSNGGMVCIII
ncbi:MAG: stage IV sporulation protein A, partial [Roseburia sp.]|nr:stage IV sporulation protein A [Roseburia sp.]